MRLLHSSRLLFGLAAGLLSAGAAQAGCNLENVASIPIRVENGHIFVAGKIDTHPVDFLVDPGSRTVLLRSAANDFGIRPDKLLSLQETTLLGVKDGAPAALAVEHLPVVVGGEVGNFGAPQEVAVLGMDFLALYDVEFDVEHGMLNLFRPTGCEKTRLGYWSRSASEADMVPNLNRVNVPPFNEYNFPHITIRLTVNGHEMLAAFDPGYAKTSLSFAAAHSVGVDKDHAVEADSIPDLLDGYTTRAWLGDFTQLAVDHETVDGAKISLRSFAPPPGARPSMTGSLMAHERYAQEDMVIGADFLLSHRVYVAYSQNKIYFSPVANQSFLGASPVRNAL